MVHRTFSSKSHWQARRTQTPGAPARHFRLDQSGRGKKGLPDELSRLQGLVRAGLAATEPLWPPLQQAYAWMYQAAHVLTNREQRDPASLQQDYQHLEQMLIEQQDQLGALAPAVAHFRKVTESYWDGLFHCYQVTGLPRTNNDLE